MRVLSAQDIDSLVSAADLIPAIDAAMRRVSERAVELPLRTVMPLGGKDFLGVMPGRLDDPACYGAKLLSLFPDNPAQGRSSHAGLMLLFDRATGLPRACLDASRLTALRTAAASALATRALSRPDSATLVLLGCGEQAEAHLQALRAVRDIRRVLVWGRDPARAAAFAAANPGVEAVPGVGEAVTAADILCTVTAAASPILFPAMLRPGQHVNAVGASVPTMQEIAPDCLPAVTLFTDYRPSLEAQAGELRDARATGLVAPDHTGTEIGEVLAGKRPGRHGDGEITLYRSLGVAAQDLAAAQLVLERAEAAGRGVEAPI
ncbi:ornithine cyclodeaminase family protein [Roseomonas sp. BN140053]|uniref:ornithine cyclodeaminase family protein n=1 Tax=Roseomonas sp. BN140053 TaxID=3391898 RepID=UPI0039EC6227